MEAGRVGILRINSLTDGEAAEIRARLQDLVKQGAQKIAVRTFERGVEDETLACGTGVVASALIFAATEKANGPISVIVRSGSELSVGFKKEGDQFRDVTLAGPAEFVFEGTIEL